MFFPGTPNVFVPGDSVFMLFKCMCNNVIINLCDLNLYKHSTRTKLRHLSREKTDEKLLNPWGNRKESWTLLPPSSL